MDLLTSSLEKHIRRESNRVRSGENPEELLELHTSYLRRIVGVSTSLLKELVKLDELPFVSLSELSSLAKELSETLEEELQGDQKAAKRLNRGKRYFLPSLTSNYTLKRKQYREGRTLAIHSLKRLKEEVHRYIAFIRNPALNDAQKNYSKQKINEVIHTAAQLIRSYVENELEAIEDLERLLQKQKTNPSKKIRRRLRGDKGYAHMRFAAVIALCSSLLVACGKQDVAKPPEKHTPPLVQKDKPRQETSSADPDQMLTKEYNQLINEIHALKKSSSNSGEIQALLKEADAYSQLSALQMKFITSSSHEGAILNNAMWQASAQASLARSTYLRALADSNNLIIQNNHLVRKHNASQDTLERKQIAEQITQNESRIEQLRGEVNLQTQEYQKKEKEKEKAEKNLKAYEKHISFYANKEVALKRGLDKKVVDLAHEWFMSKREIKGSGHVYSEDKSNAEMITLPLNLEGNRKTIIVFYGQYFKDVEESFIYKSQGNSRRAKRYREIMRYSEVPEEFSEYVKKRSSNSPFSEKLELIISLLLKNATYYADTKSLTAKSTPYSAPVVDVFEVYKTPLQMLVDGGGDCDDFSIFVSKMLLELGYTPFLVSGKTPQGGHAVCGVLVSEVGPIPGAQAFSIDGEKPIYIFEPQSSKLIFYSNGKLGNTEFKITHVERGK